MAADRVNITSPVGRIVAGSLYKGRTTDFDGKPLVVKTGANAGQPRTDYFFALAIPKGAETHWALTEWGAPIWKVGHTAFPQAAQRPDFAWKIEDGDSTIPNKRNRKPCENEGWSGHWILKFSGGFAPKVYRQDGNSWVQELTPDFVKCGYFIQAAFTVDSNGQQNNPGVYLNHSMVCFRAYGTEIVFGPNVEDAGFGAAPLPAGASMTPVAGPAPLPAQAGMPPAAPPAAPPVPVSPNPQFLQVPQPAATVAGYPMPPAVTAPTAGNSSPLPAPPAAAPVAGSVPVYKMTAAAGAASREAYHAAGWSDAQLIAQGLMTL